MEFKIVVGIVIAGAILLYKRYGSSVSIGSASVSGTKAFVGKFWSVVKKIFNWLSFVGIMKAMAIVFVGALLLSALTGIRSFWQPQVHVAKFHRVNGTNGTYYVIPEIPIGEKNEITLTEAMGFTFAINKGEEAKVFFPGAELVRSLDNMGEKAAKKLMNPLLGQNKLPNFLSFKESLTPKEGKTPLDVVLFWEGDKFVFSERKEHKVYIISGTLGESRTLSPHMYYTKEVM